MTRSARFEDVARLFGVAIFLGLAAGATHVVWVAVRQHVFGLLVWQPRDFLWHLPAAYILVFTAVAVPLALVRLVVARFALRWGVFVLATVAVLAVALLIPRLHSLALVVLSLGAGARLAIPLSSPARSGMLRRIAVVMGVVIVVLSVAARGIATVRARAAAAAQPPAPAGAPNVLLIILDTVRAASMSFQGYARETTPRLAARGAEGVIFDWAFSPSSWTLESHASAFTGRVPRELSASWTRPLDGRQPTIAEVLARHGYRTGGFVANLLYTTHQTGLARGFQHYDDYRSSWKQLLLGTTLLQTHLFWSLRDATSVAGAARALARMDLRTNVLPTPDRKLAWEVSREFLDWHASSGARPFFAFLNYYDAHLPYDPPDGFGTRFSEAPTALDRYEGAIAYLDREVGALLDSLEARRVLENTIVVITSDHGEAFGEHGASGHGTSLYLTELHVPLIIRYPRSVPAGRRVPAAVTLRELPSTVLHLVGLADSAALPGRPLTRYWAPGTEGKTDGPAVAQIAKGINAAPDLPVSRGDMAAVFDDHWHYIRNGDGREELFAYREDRREANDLVASDSGQAELPRLRALLDAPDGALAGAMPRPFQRPATVPPPIDPLPTMPP